jgi:hypothetical protein
MSQSTRPDGIFQPELSISDRREIEAFAEDIIEIPTEAMVLTDSEQFDLEVSKLEHEIVQQYIQGASINQLAARYRKYSKKQLYDLVMSALSTKSLDQDVLIGGGIFGYNEDLKALSDFLEETPKGSAVKLQAIRIRSETREKMMKYLQSVKLIPSVSTNPIETFNPMGTVKVEYEEIKRVTQDFETASPNERMLMIEDLESKERSKNA